MRIVSAFVAAIALAVLPALPAAAADDSGESITSYDVQLAVQPDGSLKVQETHRVRLRPERPARHRARDRHRAEVRRQPQPALPGLGRDRQLGTRPTRSHVSGGGEQTSLRIGDPDRTVTGPHTYRISYTVAAATTRFGDHDELYWNAVGPDWSVPVQASPCGSAASR